VILVGRTLMLAGLTPVRALQITGLAGSFAALVGAFVLARSLAGARAGVLAAVLLAVEPVFWLSGVSSPVRAYLAAGVCWALYGLLEVTRGRRRFLWITAAMLSLLSGFRPDLLPLFAIPALVAARAGGVPVRGAAAAGAHALAGCVPWIWWVGSASASPSLLARQFAAYTLHQISSTSAIFGAPPAAWQTMARQAVVWNGVAAAMAAVAAAFAGERLPRTFLVIAGACVVPALMVQLTVHLSFNGPDQALGTIAVLVVAAAALARGRLALLPLGVAGASVAFVTFAPPHARPPDLEILSLRAFARGHETSARLFEALRSALGPNDAIVVCSDSPVSARIVQAEFRRHVVLTFTAPIGDPRAPATGTRFLHARHQRLTNDPIVLAGTGRLHVLVGAAGSQRSVVMTRLCGRGHCTERAGWIQAERPEGDQVALPPYRLVFTPGGRSEAAAP
jgi:hypothetical protein